MPITTTRLVAPVAVLAALPLLLSRDPRRAQVLDRAARGLGKLCWMKGFEPHFYGVRELARLERQKPA